ncbi:ribokinase [Clostridium sp. KNHs216]|uniref:ribokinase n=1 Tax=Clostridium sp. KNHs216 TaxID=1550235 RepID=UPI00325B442D
MRGGDCDHRKPMLRGDHGRKMKVLNYGSLNMDYVYSVHHIVREGETLAAEKREIFCGGKGLNQSIALARAGVPVYHAGAVGEDGGMLLQACRENGIDASLIRKTPGASGHAVIQVDQNGRNSIVLFGGGNRSQTREYADEVLSRFGEGDILVLQNEINLLDYIIDRAWKRKMFIALNPSPFNEAVQACDLKKVSLLLLNEIESAQITGKTDPDEVLDALSAQYPSMQIVLTLGEKGSVYANGGRRVRQKVFQTQAVDTTAAGDTFTGFYLAGVVCGQSVEEALRTASKAASIAVSRPGASASVPFMAEVLKGLGS